MFVDQTDDQSRLQQQRRSDQHDLPVILLPGSRLAKTGFASGRQVSLANPPPLQLPPVENWSDKLAGDNGNVGRAFAVENAQGKARGTAAHRTRINDQTTNSP